MSLHVKNLSVLHHPAVGKPQGFRSRFQIAGMDVDAVARASREFDRTVASCHCGKVAHYHVGKQGYCRQHREDAVKARAPFALKTEAIAAWIEAKETRIDSALRTRDKLRQTTRHKR